MPKPRLPFLRRCVTQHGKVVYYVKLSSRQRGRGTRINAPYYSEAFMQAYHAAVRGTPITSAPVVAKNSKGTVSWLIKLYRESRDWCHNLSHGTRKQRGPIYKRMEEQAGDLPLSAITRKKVEEGMSARTDNQARHFLNAVSALYRWAIANELFDGRNPAEGITRTRSDGGDNDGHLPWPIELIEKFEKRWPVGTKERLVFDVYLYVGLRRGDAAKLGKQHIRHGIVHLVTEKSQGKMPIYVPIHPELTKSIKACPSSGLAIIGKDNGTNYTKESLGNLFREAVEAAGIPVTKKGSKEKGYSAHGLRKASATIAAESGASEAELNAMFGWSGHQMAQLYTKNADRKKLAVRATQKWKRPSSEEVARDSELAFLQLEKERG
ncbi:site-specific integrase [Bradyrhizobium arachidis]|uniref:tyrosine-type recombinase/integrase n=1 Tax=Bradyrhizobium arachidis TaxID=858423 RepID=UPI002163C67E|nr:site-specific integrase [Bradyrhizobium arachidis]UVO30172.1 site-specific integrase [Bradyrhizobium arachidis]